MRQFSIFAVAFLIGCPHRFVVPLAPLLAQERGLFCCSPDNDAKRQYGSCHKSTGGLHCPAFSPPPGDSNANMSYKHVLIAYCLVVAMFCKYLSKLRCFVCYRQTTVWKSKLNRRLYRADCHHYLTDAESME